MRTFCQVLCARRELARRRTENRDDLGRIFLNIGLRVTGLATSGHEYAPLGQRDQTKSWQWQAKRPIAERHWRHACWQKVA